MKVAITGSNGFIGSHLVDALLERGADVRCLVRSESVNSKPGTRSFVIDYADVASLTASQALDDVDVLIHVAGVTKSLDLAGFRQGNVMPTQHLIEALVDLNTPIKRFVLISSQAASGPAKNVHRPTTEFDQPAPFEPYGQSKLEAEELLRGSDLPFAHTIIRPSTVYGPRDVDFLPLFKQLKKGRGLYPGNRLSYVSVIHVADLVNGILLASTHPAAIDQTYFLTNETVVSWREIYRVISKAFNKPMWEFNIPFSFIQLAGQLGDLQSRITGSVSLINSNKIALSRPVFWNCSAEKAKTQIGFSPDISLPEGMSSTLHWYRENGWI